MGARKNAHGRIVRTNRSDGRTVEICLTGYAWQKRREEVFFAAEGWCSRCDRFAPLHESVDPETGRVIQRAGHAHHKTPRGRGRDDGMGNLEWLCWKCHDREHRPGKAVPSK